MWADIKKKKKWGLEKSKLNMQGHYTSMKG